jgi:D-alanyl-D-alanine carboxypeptidase
MMLPSGNDAATALAEFFGQLLLDKSQSAEDSEACFEPEENLQTEIQVLSINQIRSRQPFLARGSQYPEDSPIAFFLQEMNKNCIRLGLRSSFFDNPHGLMNHNSKSTAFDIAKLANFALADPRFKKVVRCKYFELPKMPSEGRSRTYKWENTNKLLENPNVEGVKTGITQSAGPCLCTAINAKELRVIVVLLCSKSMDIRFSETIKLQKWAIKRMQTIRQFQMEVSRGQPSFSPEFLESTHSRLLKRLKHL